MSYIIKYTEAQQIIDMACSSWKERLAVLWATSIVLKKDIEVSEELYNEGYDQANEKQKRVIDKIFGKSKDIFSVTSYAEICKQLGEKEITSFDFTFVHPNSRDRMASIAKMSQIERFFNQWWKPNWKDHNEPKWYAWFIDRGKGLVFDGADCRRSGAYGGVAYFKNEKITQHVVKHFSDIYIGCIEK
jgi:hypothetical protein